MDRIKRIPIWEQRLGDSVRTLIHFRSRQIPTKRVERADEVEKGLKEPMRFGDFHSRGTSSASARLNPSLRPACSGQPAQRNACKLFLHKVLDYVIWASMVTH